MILALLLGPPDAQTEPAGHTYYTVPARDVPIVVTANRRGEGKVWNVAGPPRLVSTFRIETDSALRREWDGINAYTAIASPKGDRAMIIEPGSHRFRVVRLRPFKELWRGGGVDAQLVESAWSGDGRSLMVPSRLSWRTSAVYDAGTGRLRGRIALGDPFAVHGRRVYGIGGTFSRPNVRGYDLRTLRPTLRIDDPTAEGPLGVSPDGRYLVGAGRDRSGFRYEYRVWRTSDGRLTGRFLGQGRSMNFGRLDPLFLSGGRFALLKLGELRRLPDGRLLRRFPAAEYGGSEGVEIVDPKAPLRPRYVDPK